MKLQNTNTNRKKITFSLIAMITLGLLAISTLAYKYHWGPFSVTPSSEEVKEAQNNSDATNDQQKDSKGQTTNPNVDASKTTNEIPVSTLTTLSITRLVQEDGNIKIASNLENPGASGTCSVQFTSDVAKPVSRTVDAVNGTCPEITIPEQEFSAIGTWKATLRYYTSDTQAVDTKITEIK